MEVFYNNEFNGKIVVFINEVKTLSRCNGISVAVTHNSSWLFIPMGPE